MGYIKTYQNIFSPDPWSIGGLEHIGNIGSGEMHEFNETAHLVELEAEDEEEHIHEVLHGAPSRAGS